MTAIEVAYFVEEPTTSVAVVPRLERLARASRVPAVERGAVRQRLISFDSDVAATHQNWLLVDPGGSVDDSGDLTDRRLRCRAVLPDAWSAQNGPGRLGDVTASRWTPLPALYG